MPPSLRIRRVCARLHFLADLMEEVRKIPASPPAIEDCIVRIEASAKLLEHELHEEPPATATFRGPPGLRIRVATAAAAGPTTWSKTIWLDLKLVSPPYTTLIASLPTANVDVVSAADLVGTPAPGCTAVTVAVNFSSWP